MSAPAAGPTPLQSFLGGLALALPVQALLALNGTVFGISGFLHSAARGAPDAAASVAGLVLGGLAVGALDPAGPLLHDPAPLPLVLSGLLVGAGTKMGNGCTSGHMICGVSRLSLRSIAATATFCTTASLTARTLHATTLAPAPADASLGAHGHALLLGSALLLAAALLARRARRAVALLTGAGFALALRLSNLGDPRRVLAFLLTPAHAAFDGSLVWLALGALPLAAALYRAGGVRVPPRGRVDARLLVGAALFGVGWGIEGICPGPGLMNFGWALVTRRDVVPLATWLGAVVAGGFLVPS
ncbi:hypothetical protein BC834DRAFT_853436 [Gloeopeniophorella convolvens]|nr:hypothetical protein BC834DRAFT_853436 [Gloeopeniophorella convolvens]